MRAPSDLSLRPVESRGELKQFIRMPDAVYRDDPHWVRPLMIERMSLLDKAQNPYFEHAQACYWTAFRGGRPVGRISAQVDRLVEEKEGARIGHFGMFEAHDDPEVAAALFAAAEAWLAERGCLKVQGPFNLSTNGECGLLVDGFDTPPYIMMGHARPYYRALIEGCGYVKAKDTIAYDFNVREDQPPRNKRIIAAGARNPALRIREIDMSRYAEELVTIIDIFNDAWADNWGFVQLTEAEARHLAKEIKPLIEPHRVHICEFDGEPVGMMVTLPDLNDLIKDLKGELLPFGWAKLFWRLKVTYPPRMRCALMGVRRSLQRSRYSAAIALMLIEAARPEVVKRGAVESELSWVLEDNKGLRTILEEMGAKIYKTYRLFEKPLA